MAKPKPPRPSKAIRKALDRAIQIMGGIVQAAAKLDVTISAIQNWRKNGMSGDRALQIEKLSGVSRALLRPDLYA